MMARLRALLVDGVLLALPLGAGAYIVYKALHLALKLLAPVAGLLPQGRWAGIAALEVVAVGLLLMALLVLGLFARSAWGRRLGQAIEGAVTSRIPGYQVAKSVLAGLAGTAVDDGMRPVIVSFDDNAVLGLAIEQPVDTGQVTVFIPGAPGAASGSVVLVPRARVQWLDATLGDARRAMRQRGLGLQGLTKAQSPGST